jgi:soluble lytic murein transglycosylase
MSSLAVSECEIEKENFLYLSYCYKKNGNLDLAISNLDKIDEDGFENVADFLAYRKIKLLSSYKIVSNEIKEEIRKFKATHNDSVLLPKIELIEAKRLLAISSGKPSSYKSHKILSKHLQSIDKKYGWSNNDRINLKRIKAMNLLNLGQYGQGNKLFQEIYINHPNHPSVVSWTQKLSKNDLRTRLNSLFKNRMFRQFTKESQGREDPDIRIKIALIKIKTGKRDEGRRILKDISEGNFKSTDLFTDNEIIAESLYQLHVDDLKTSKDNSKIARNLKLILKNYPNYRKKNDVAYLSARLFTLDKNYLEAKQVYSWLIKTKSEGYIDNSFWGLGWSEYMLKNYRDALNHFSSLAHSDEPYHQARGLYWKARCLEKLGDLNSAKKTYMKILENHKMGYYLYLASIKLDKKFHSKPNIIHKKQGVVNLNQEMKLLFSVKHLNVAHQEVASYIKKKINSSNYRDYLIALESAQEFNLVIKLSYQYPSEAYHKYPKGFINIIETHSKKYGLDKNLILGLIREESLFDPNAVSHVGAMGLMQIMNYTGKQIKKDLKSDGRLVNLNPAYALFDPETNILMGTYYLSSLIKKFDNNIFLALAAYNGGPKNVQKWLVRFDGLEDDEFVENIPFKETHGYVKRVLRSYFYYMLN